MKQKVPVTFGLSAKIGANRDANQLAENPRKNNL